MFKSENMNNYFIDMYIDGFENRMNKQESFKTRLFFKVLPTILALILLKNIFCLFFDFSNETKLLLYDLSILLGGIQKFNGILVISLLTLTLFLNIKLHLGKDHKPKELVHIFKQIRGSPTLFWKTDESKVLERVRKFASIIYKLYNITISFFGKLTLLNHNYL